jgi:PAS domain S-box-containing protein
MSDASPPDKPPEKRLTPQRIAAIYAAVAGLWILLSDRIVNMMSSVPEIITRLQTYKGWFFVLVTALMLSWLIRRYGDELAERARQAALGAEIGARLVQNRDLRGILQLCAEAIVRHLDAAFARIWTLNEKEDVLELQASAGLYTHLNGPHGRVPVGSLKIGMIALEKKPHLTNAVLDDPRISDPEWARREGMVAFAGHPLIVADRLVGVMAMFSRKPLKETALTALASIADEIALGIMRTRTEESLQESESKLCAITDTALDAVVLVDDEGKIRYWNPSASRLFGYTRAEVAGKNMTIIIPERYRDAQALAFKTFVETGRGSKQGRIYETFALTKDGTEVPVEVSISGMKLKGRWHSAGIIRDISERKNLEDQLRQAQKMEAIGQLAGGIAHDFNNILSAIIGYGSLLQKKMPEDDPRRANLEHILESADRAAHLTHSLLAFSRNQLINPRPVDLNAVIQRVQMLLRRIIGEDIELETVFGQKAVMVSADSGQLEQVFMNLATNARDAMPKGGALTIKTDTLKLDETVMHAHGYGEPGAYALVSVTDTGMGMDAETQKRIFEPFFTTKELGKGTGLGLSMVYGIIKQHNGYINVYSEPGRGTTFKIYLPALRVAAAEKQPSERAHPKELPRGTETVLVAEDDDALRKLCRIVLEEYGYRVIDAEDGEEAVNKFREHQDAVQLAIFDIIMPKKSGRETYEEISKIRPGMKVIFMSGYTADKILTERVLEERMELILKPIAPDDLLRKVREVLDS